MPLYDFSCPHCGHRFEEFKRLAERDEPEPCPSCGKPARRGISAAAVMTGGAGRPAASDCAPGGGG